MHFTASTRLSIITIFNLSDSLFKRAKIVESRELLKMEKRCRGERDVNIDKETIADNISFSNT